MLISRVTENNGRKYFEYKGRPQLFYGIQLRLDDAEGIGANEEDIETYFRMAAAYNFPIVAVPLHWGEHIEPYISIGADSEFVKNTLHYADKYNLSVQWLWFGSNVCGVNSVPGCLPADIWNDEKKYPRVRVEGRECVDVTNPAFIEREQTAVKYFMDMLLRLDENYRTSAVQIENEPDMNGFGDLTNRKNNLKLIDILGKTVKKSDFSVITRVNTTAPEKYMGEDMLLSDILALDGIDAVGVDVYHKDIKYFSNFSDYMSGLPKNLPHFSEMGPHVDVTPRFICDTLARGCGTIIYEMKTVGNRDFDFGLFRNSDKDWIERDGTKPVQYQWTAGEMTAESNTADIGILNGMISVLNDQLATSPTGNIAMILKGETKSVGEYTVGFNTEESGINAFAMTVAADDGYLYMFTLAQTGTFNFPDITETYSSLHNYNEWKLYEKVNGVLKAERGCVYRIKK